MTRMNPTIRTRWAHALRSGVFTQGEGFLHDPSTGEHCCLGVLCHLAAQDGIVTTKLATDPASGNEVTRFVGATHQDGSTERLPKAVQLWAGLSSPDPTIEWGTYDGFVRRDEVTELNDYIKLPFTELADLIEESL